MRHYLITALILGVFALPLAGCKDEGPMEKAGKKMDEAAEEIGDEIDDMHDDD